MIGKKISFSNTIFFAHRLAQEDDSELSLLFTVRKVHLFREYSITALFLAQVL
jgi:hypothetical protein